MSSNSVDIEIQRLRQRYADLWEAILKRHAVEARNKGDEPLFQAKVAKELRVAAAAVSRLINGKALPRSLDLLVKVAQRYGTTQEETRVLVAWASAIAASDASEYAVAEVFMSMFRPLYAAEQLTRRMIGPPQAAYNTLLDLGVSRDVADDIADQVRDCRTLEDVIGRIVLHGNETVQEALKTAGHERLVALANAYSRVAVIDFDGPFTDLSAVRPLRRAANRGDCEPPKAWKGIKNLVISRIKIRAGKVVPDLKHEGVEFLFLERGSGRLTIEGVGDVQLDEKTRQFIAYRPVGPHSFSAGTDGATLYVISYSRPGENEDPTDDLLAAAAQPRTP